MLVYSITIHLGSPDTLGNVQDLKQDELPYAMPSQPRQQQVISLPFPPQQQQPQPIRLPQSTSVRIPLHQTVYRQLQQQQQREEDGGSQTQSQVHILC